MTHIKDTTNQPPYLLAIGAAKAGTTWLWDNLKEHPDLWTLPYKSTQYFSGKAHPVRKKKWRRHRSKILSNLRPGNLAWHYRYFASKPVDDQWFVRQFSPAKAHQTRIDISTSFAGLPLEKIEHVKTLIPNTKVVYLLRNPIERMWSHAKLTLIVNGGRKYEDITVAEYLDYFGAEGMLLSTNYIENYERWSGVLGKENVFVGFFDQVGQDPFGLLQDLCGFMDVPYQESYFATTAKRNIFKGVSHPMPEEVRAFLEEKYTPLIKDIQDRFGSYSKDWLTSTPASLPSS
ncbi:MAG: sulfotransferase [Bacteroidota bacterium]